MYFFKKKSIVLKKTVEEALETKRSILQSALDLFYQKGYSKTTFEEISARIGLTKGAVYWYFKNKPELVAALINMYVERKTAYLNAKVPNLGCFDDIKHYFLATSDYILGDENALKLAFFLSLQMEWSQSIITKVMEKIHENMAHSFELIKDALLDMQKNGQIRDDTDAALIAEIIFNSWTGNLEAFFSKRSSTDLKIMIEKSFDLLFNGLIKKKD